MSRRRRSRPPTGNSRPRCARYGPNDPLAPGDHRYIRTGPDAVTHLLRVGCGLDSMVVGDVQILGQVKEAYQIAREAGTSGPLLDRLFQTALHAGKRARTETSIGVGTVSVSSAVVEMAAHRDVARANGHEICPRHEHGLTGNTSSSSVPAKRRGWLRSTPGSTRPPRSRSSTGRAGAARRWRPKSAERPACSTSCRASLRRRMSCSPRRAPQSRSDRGHAARRMAERGGRPLVVFDMAVPRDVEPAAGESRACTSTRLMSSNRSWMRT